MSSLLNSSTSPESDLSHTNSGNNNPLTNSSFLSFDVDAYRMEMPITTVSFPFQEKIKAGLNRGKECFNTAKEHVKNGCNKGKEYLNTKKEQFENCIEDKVRTTNEYLSQWFGTAEIPDEKTINNNLRAVEGVCSKPKIRLVNPNNRDINKFQVELTEPLKCHLVIDNQVFDFTIPAGYKTDLASIPSSVSNGLPPWGDYATAAIIHDYLYDVAPCDKNGEQITRWQSDWAFCVCMKQSGVSWEVRSLLFDAVITAGGAPWRRSRENQ